MPVPLAFITNRSLSLLVKLSENASLSLSGDHAASNASRLSLVSLRTFVPLGRIVYTANAPLRALLNVIRLPSDDQSERSRAQGDW